MANLIQITSVPAEKLAENTLQVVASWKSTEKRTIPAANAKRAVILPSNIWNAEDDVKNLKSDALRLHVLDGIAELAKEYLSQICEESNWQRTEVNMEAFTLTALLNWSAERAALSGRLNGEEIKNWLSESHTIKAVATSHGEKIAGALGEQFVKLASPNHGLTPEKAQNLLSKLWKSEDCDSTTGLRVSLRLQAIAKKQSEQNVLDSIL